MAIGATGTQLVPGVDTDWPTGPHARAHCGAPMWRKGHRRVRPEPKTRLKSCSHEAAQNFICLAPPQQARLCKPAPWQHMPAFAGNASGWLAALKTVLSP